MKFFCCFAKKNASVTFTEITETNKLKQLSIVQKTKELKKITKKSKALNETNIVSNQFENVLSHKSTGKIEIVFFCRDIGKHKIYFVHSELLITNYFTQHTDKNTFYINVVHNSTPYDFLLWLYKKDISPDLLTNTDRLNSFIELSSDLKMINLCVALKEITQL